jgi:hypothetical protein
MFALSDPSIVDDLLHEFTLHAGVIATSVGADDGPLLRVETVSSTAALWDVRATVGMFDDGAREVVDQA